MQVGLKQLKNYSEKFIRYEIGLKIVYKSTKYPIEERFYVMARYINADLVPNCGAKMGEGKGDFIE